MAAVFTGFSGGLDGKASVCNAGDLGSIPGSGRFLEKGMATTPVFLPGELPGTEDPAGLQCKGSQSWT